MRRFVLLVLVAAAGALAACSSVPSESGTDAPRGSRYLITSAEIASISVSTAFDAVERLRPSFFRVRGGSPLVYLNGVRVGEIDALRSVLATSVEAIRFMPARDATTRYGTGHGNGVIEVSTKN